MSRDNQSEVQWHDVNEIIRLLANQSWTENRDGMTSLQVYLQGNKKLSVDETHRIRDVCNKFFSDPHIKVYRIFLDVLSEFIIHYRVNLNDWIFVLLTRLLHKIGSDILPSLHSKVARVLDIVRDSFPYDQQFQILTKYITDSTQTPTLKMKIAILHYIQGLIKLMDSSDFVNTGATRLAVSRIITWTSEPKSSEVRKEAASVIVALFELNTPVFSTMLAVLPNSFQDGATKLLHSHLRPLTNRVPHTPKPVPEYNADYEDYATKYASPVAKGQTRLGYRSISPTKHQTPVAPSYDTTDSPANYRPGHDQSPMYSAGGRYSAGRPDVRDGAEAGDGKAQHVMSKLNFSGDSMNDSSEKRGSSGGYEPRSQERKVYEKQLVKGHDMTPKSHNTLNDISLSSELSPPRYDPKQYEDKIAGNADDKTMLSPEMLRVADGAEEPDRSTEPPSPTCLDLVNEITAVLSARRNESGSEDVKSALVELIKLTRTGAKEYVPNIKNLMPIVTETLKHTEGAIRCLAARAIREVIRSLPDVYKDDMKHVILRLIETQGDPLKEVSKTAEECCNLIAEHQPPADVINVLCPIIEAVQFPLIVTAIKMLNVVIDTAQIAAIKNHLQIIVTALLKGYDHTESTVRKASVFCLVSLHNLVGQDALNPYLEVLNASKLKLLNLYIKRSQASQ
eukprot:gene3264-3745_t